MITPNHIVYLCDYGKRKKSWRSTKVIWVCQWLTVTQVASNELPFHADPIGSLYQDVNEGLLKLGCTHYKENK